MAWDYLTEIGSKFEAIAVNALAGLIVSFIWAGAVWSYLCRRDQRNIRLLKEKWQNPRMSSLGCGRDLVFINLTNPADRPVSVISVEVRFTSSRGKLQNGDPVPGGFFLNGHGREFRPYQFEPDFRMGDLPPVTLCPGETHCWWATKLKDTNDYWFTRIEVSGVIITLQYEGFNKKPILFTIHADKTFLSFIQQHINSLRQEVTQGSKEMATNGGQ